MYIVWDLEDFTLSIAFDILFDVTVMVLSFCANSLSSSLVVVQILLFETRWQSNCLVGQLFPDFH